MTNRDEGNPENGNDSNGIAHEAQMESALHKFLPCSRPQKDGNGVGNVQSNRGNGHHGRKGDGGFEHWQAQEESKCDHEPDCIDGNPHIGVDVGPNSGEGEAVIPGK